MSNSNITDWLNYELYPQLFDDIDKALPELNFTRYNGGWRSGKKLDLSAPKEPRKDKTVVTEKVPHRLLEQGGETISIINYVMRRDNIEFIDAVKYLTNIVGLKLPDNKDYNEEGYQKRKDKETLLEALNSYFVYLLNESSTGGKDRDKVLEYLTESRGYSLEDIKAMELGYIPNNKRLIDEFIRRGYTKELIEEALGLDKDSRIGKTHKLSIAYRAGGVIKGFKLRTVEESINPKYLNSSGLDKIGGFFNIQGLKGDKDLIIVEGELDCLIATVKGVDNVVALGGSSLSPQQIEDAVKRGAKKFTICLDTEAHKEAETIKKINTMIDIILKLGYNQIYVATLPLLASGDKTDPDSFIKYYGVKDFIEVITNALPYYEYWVQNIIDKYVKKGILSPKDKDNMLEEIVSTGSNIIDPLQRDMYINKAITYRPLLELGINKESLQGAVERLGYNKDKEAQDKEVKKLLSEAQDKQAKGDTAGALELMESKVKELKLIDKKATFKDLYQLTSEVDIRDHYKNAPDSLKSGFTINQMELLLPAGALTGVAGATGHGKTDFLINTALNTVKLYRDKVFYFLTYEMSQEAILMRFLNTYLKMDLDAVSNIRALKNYYKTGDIIETAREAFKEKSGEFFKEIIETGRLRVKGINYNSQELNTALYDIAKNVDNIGGFYIDYLQLLKLSKEGYRNYSRQEELKIICQDLHTTAKDIQLPVVLGAQFNREVTTPLKLHATNIGEAGDIERVLDTLIGIWYTNKPYGEKLVGKDEALIKEKIQDKKDKLYTVILKSRETSSDVEELLNYNAKQGLITNNDAKTGSTTPNDFFLKKNKKK
jgi:DNA primase catalytic core